MSKSHQVLLYLASLWVAMVACQGKADLTYKSTGSLGKIKDMVLSSENKMFALKTTDAKIDGTEYPVWVGNTDNWGPAFSSPWMTNAAPSCAFFNDKLYIAPKANTNFLYRVDVGYNKVPHVRSANLLTFDAQGETKMQAPYLYATTNNLYAIEDTKDGIQVHVLGENDNQSLSLVGSISVDSSENKPIQTACIKDIVSKNVNGVDCLYILTTNGSQTANLWLAKANETNGGCITPKEWLNDYQVYGMKVIPLFDHTTSITVHGDRLLSTNANVDDTGMQFGFISQINQEGKLDSTEWYLHSDTLRTSAIGSDQKTYYAEEIQDIDYQGVVKRFIKGNPGPELDPQTSIGAGGGYSNRSENRHGEAVYKFITRKEGEIFAISQNNIYRIRENE